MKMPPPQHFVMDQNWPFGTKISHLGPKKPPGTVKSLKWPFWSFSAPGGHWEKRKQIYIMTLVQLFSIYMTSIHPRHLPDTLRRHPDTARHHPDTPQKPPYLTCMRPLGERVISEYHDIYSTVFNFPDNCLTQTSARHAQTLSRNCQTPSRHLSNAPILL